MAKKKWDLFALAFIPLVMTLGNSMLIPVLPTIEKKLDITAFQSSMIITVYSVVAIFLIPIAGYLSDKIGRKKVIIPSLIIVGIGGIISSFAAWKLDNPYSIILVGRFLQGIGAAGAFPVVIPTVGDMFKDEDQVSKGLGIIETANTFGKVLSPILGALLAYIIWFVPFIAIPILSLIAILLVIFLVKKPKDTKEEKEDFKSFLVSIKEIFKNNLKWLLAVFIIGGINMFVLFSFLFHLSSVLEDDFQMNSILKGFTLAIPLLLLSIASFFGGKKIGQNKVAMKWIIVIGNSMAAIALLFVRTNSNLFLLITCLTVAGIGIGASLPCLDALITEGIEKKERGSITSIYSSMRFIGVAAGPPAAALMMKSIPGGMYFSLSFTSVVAVLFSIFFIKPSKVSSEEKQTNKLEPDPT